MAEQIKNTLSGCRVLVTRPSAQAEQWQQQLSEAGAVTVALPLLAIRPFEEDKDEVAVRAIKNMVLDFDRFSHIIFVSQNAVRAGMEWLEEYWPQLPQQQQFFAVGKATALALAAHDVDVVAADAAMNSEALLALPELQAEQVKAAQVLIFRGQGGRPYLAEELTKRGAEVSYCELYQREFPGGAEEVIKKLNQHRWGEPGDLVAVHSGESLNNGHAAERIDEPEKQKVYLTLPLLVPGERVANAAREFGFSEVVTALNATDEAMLGALRAWYESKAKNSEIQDVVETDKNNSADHEDKQKALAMTTEKTVEKIGAEEKEASAKKPPVVKKTASKFIVFLNLVLLLTVAALVALGYLGWQQLQLSEQKMSLNVQQQSQLQQRLNQQEQLIAENAQGLKVTQGQQRAYGDKWQQKLVQHENRLRQQQQQLNNLTSTSRSDWQLAEAEYLLRLANQNLLMKQGVQGALEMLLAADNILLDVGDMDLFSIREQLANDIAALKLVPKLDRSGLYLKLSALSDQVLVMPEDVTVLLKQESAAPQITQQEVSTPTTWIEKLSVHFKAAMAKLDKYIQIRPHDQPIQPLLSQANSALVRQNVSLLLEQAQLALLKEEQEIFQKSLARASEQINQHFSLQGSAKIIVEQLNEMANKKVSIDVPSISGSLNALQDHIKVVHSLKNADAQAAPVTDSHGSKE